MPMTSHWICVQHRWGTPPSPCGDRGEGDGSAARHTEKSPHHPTVTTTRPDLADKLARPVDACTSCGRSWDPDLEPSGGHTCPDCQHTERREAAT